MTVFLPTATALASLAKRHGGRAAAKAVFNRMVWAGTIKPWPEVPGWWELTPAAAAEINGNQRFERLAPPD